MYKVYYISQPATCLWLFVIFSFYFLTSWLWRSELLLLLRDISVSLLVVYVIYAMQSWCDILVLRLRTEAERITSSLGEGCDETLSSAFIILGDNLVVMMSESDGTPWYHIIHDHMYVCILILLHVFGMMICGCHNVAISHYMSYGFFTIVTTWSWRFHFFYRKHLNVLPLCIYIYEYLYAWSITLYPCCPRAFH